MTTSTSFVGRSYVGEADLQPICDLLNLVDAADKLDDSYSVEDLSAEFADPHFDVQCDLRLWENSAGQLVAVGEALVSRESDPPEAFIWWRADPAARTQELADDIFAWGEQRRSELSAELGKPVDLRSGALEHESYAREQLERHGYSVARYYFRMARPLNEPIPEPQFPAGFVLRHAQGEADIAPWVEMYNQSFIDHYNFHPRTVEVQIHETSVSKYIQEGDLIAIAPDGTFAAFCFCWVDNEDNERNNRKRGWIERLGTRRGFRNMGLGRAMLLSGLRWLKSQGLETAVLSVDAANPTGALRLYESVGFERFYTSLGYRKSYEL